MRRGIAVTWHLVSFLISAALYFFFVLPRWPELMGDTSHTLGTVLRIATGSLFGLSALPVVFTLIETRKPEFGTPQLALSLRLWSIVGHVTAGVLIAGTAIAEIWLDLDVYGGWLFAIYGGAAAIALLGATAFYLAFAAELPPPPPKPLKPRKAARDADKVTEPAEAAAAAEDDAPAGETEIGDQTETDADTETPEEPTDEPEAKPARPALRNRRQRKPSGGVALSD
jgi:hypothetical protein